MEKYKFLRPEEVGRLFCAIDLDASYHAIRNKAIFALAKYCALRVSEIGMLQINDYDEARCNIYCRREKNGNNNTIQIVEPYVQMAMNDYISIRSYYPQSEYLFVSQLGNPISRKMLDVIMKKHAAIAKLPPDKHHFHVLRHTRAVELGEMGLDTKDIQWWLGHKSISSTMVYHQFTTRQQQSLYEKIIAYQQK